MESTEKQMSHEDSLQLIQSMINTARNKVAEDGFHLILWGVLVIICSLVNYFMIQTGHVDFSFVPWIIMPMVGVPIGIYYEKKLKREGHVRSLMDIHVGHMWWSYGIAMFIGILYCVNIQISPVPFILLITGLVTFATGLTLRFIPLTIGGCIFWVLTIVCLYVKPVDHLLVEAIAVLTGYIVPGIMLRQKAKSESHV